MRKRKRRRASKAHVAGRAGGRAAASGFYFQAIYISLQLAKLLGIDDKDWPQEVLWEKKALDTGDGKLREVYVDDVILRMSNGISLFVQVKENSGSNGWSIRSFIRSGVADQLWKQWSSDSQGRTLVRLATGGNSERLRKLVDVAARARTPGELLSDEATKQTTSDIVELASALGMHPDNPRILDFLKALSVEALQPAEDLVARLRERLAIFGRKGVSIENALIRIVSKSTVAGHTARSGYTRESIIQALVDSGTPREMLLVRSKDGSGIAQILDRMRTCKIKSFNGKRHYVVEEVVPSSYVTLTSPTRRGKSMLRWQDIELVYHSRTEESLRPAIVDKILRDQRFLESSTMCALVLAMKDSSRVDYS